MEVVQIEHPDVKGKPFVDVLSLPHHEANGWTVVKPEPKPAKKADPAPATPSTDDTLKEN